MKSFIYIHNDNYKLIAGETMRQLIKGFGYTLECGYSWNRKIQLEPKTVKSLINNLYKSNLECRKYDCCYYSTNNEAMKNFIKTLNQEELDEIKNGRSGLWKNITFEEFKTLSKD